MSKKKNTYSDIDLSFNKHPVTGDIPKVVDDNAIKKSVEYLLSMEYFNTPMQPEKGSGVYRVLFEPMGIDAVLELKEAITEVINKYEPRIELQEVQVEADYDNSIYNINIVFKILNSLDLKQIKFILKKVN